MSGNYAYLTGSYAARLTVVDVSNPLQPTIAASIQNASVGGNTLPLSVDVQVGNGFAYVADEGSSVPSPSSTCATTRRRASEGSIAGVADLNGAYRIRPDSARP